MDISNNWNETIKKDSNNFLKKLYLDNREEIVFWITKNYNIPSDAVIDIFQSSIIQFYQNAKDDKIAIEEFNIKSYLFGICKNKCYEYLRAHKVKHDSLDPKSLNFSEPNTDLIDYKNEQISLILKNMKLLKKSCIELLDFFYYQNKSLAEITLLMKYKNKNSTKSAKFKCLQRLYNSITNPK